MHKQITIMQELFSHELISFKYLNLLNEKYIYYHCKSEIK